MREAHSYVNTYNAATDPYGNLYSHFNTNSYSNSNDNSYCDSYCHTKPDSDTHCYAGCYSDSDSYTVTDAESCANA